MIENNIVSLFFDWPSYLVTNKAKTSDNTLSEKIKGQNSAQAESKYKPRKMKDYSQLYISD